MGKKTTHKTIWYCPITRKHWRKCRLSHSSENNKLFFSLYQSCQQRSELKLNWLTSDLFTFSGKFKLIDKGIRPKQVDCVLIVLWLCSSEHLFRSFAVISWILSKLTGGVCFTTLLMLDERWKRLQMKLITIILSQAGPDWTLKMCFQLIREGRFHVSLKKERKEKLLSY